MYSALIGKVDRLRIHMPPRHGKTETVTIRAVLYLLLTRPGVNILVTGYNERFAKKLGRRIRNAALEMGIGLADDKTAADEWYTADGSLVMARGVGSPPTGQGFDFIFIDDPIRRREDAESEAFREKAWDWYTDDLLSRLQPEGVIIGCWTLWHEDDLAGRLTAAQLDGGDVWEVLKLPAIDEAGNALWPEVWPLHVLKRRRAAMIKKDGNRSWEALFQQNPSPAEGDVFKIFEIKYVDASPIPWSGNRARAWDLAASENKGDWTVGTLMAGPDADGIYYIEDIVRARLEPAKRNKLIRATAERDGPSVSIMGPQDPAAAGKESAASFVSLLAGFPVKTKPVSGDKVVRCGPFAAQVNAGNVAIVRAKWNAAFVEELRTFPGKNDDQVDSAGDAFKVLAPTRSVALEVW